MCRLGGSGMGRERVRGRVRGREIVRGAEGVMC